MTVDQANFTETMKKNVPHKAFKNNPENGSPTKLNFHKVDNFSDFGSTMCKLV